MEIPMNTRADVTYTQMANGDNLQGKTVESAYYNADYLLITFTDGTFFHIAAFCGMDSYGDMYGYLAADALPVKRKLMLGLLSEVDSAELAEKENALKAKIKDIQDQLVATQAQLADLR
jgi:hypothetical protein